MIPLKFLHVVLIYLVIINVVTFFVYGIDKWKAKNSKWRTRETALLGLAVLGGSIGAWLGMKVWHHKTQHKGGNCDIDNTVGGYQFKYGIPAIIIVQLAIIVSLQSMVFLSFWKQRNIGSCLILELVMRLSEMRSCWALT